SGNYSTFVDYVMWKARKPPMEGVVTVSEVVSRGDQAPQMGLSLPWETLSEQVYGQRFGECTCIAGGVGGGKTTVLHEIIGHNIKDHKEPVFVALLEERNINTCRNVAGIMDSTLYKKPEVFSENKEQYYQT